MKWVVGIVFVLAGVNHFAHPDFYMKIMPPYLPSPRLLVAVSGAAEVLLGILLLIPRFTVPAAWGIIALLFAVFPANLHMALHAELYPEFPPAALWGRPPLQGVLIALVYWFTRTPRPTATPGCARGR